MSDSNDSQNEAQFGRTGGFQFVAYTLDVALWGAAMICEERSSGDSSRCKKLTNAKLIATNHVVLYAVQNYKDLILLFGNYEAQNVIILEKLLTAFCPPLVHRNEDNVMLGSVLTFYLPLTVIEVLRQSDLDVPRWVFVAPVLLVSIENWQQAVRDGLGAGENESLCYQPWGNDKACSIIISMGASAADLRMHYFPKNDTLITDDQKHVIYSSKLSTCPLIYSIVYVISVCGMLMSRESLLEELRGQDGIISTYDVTGAVNEENRRNFSGNSVDGAVHVTTSVVRWIDQIPEDQEIGTEVNAEKDTSSSTARGLCFFWLSWCNF
ncbi:hypothetical protein B0H13DRAFT_1883164 [Mycena leptocephala]|nr:hypothetical protein B0H13DRAFT_1883164 [Mycena leptocephala]